MPGNSLNHRTWNVHVTADVKPSLFCFLLFGNEGYHHVLVPGPAIGRE